MKYNKILVIFISFALLATMTLFIFSRYIASTESVVSLETQVGDKIPGFVLDKITSIYPGVDLNSTKVIVFNFWASWCSPCVEELPSLIKLSKLLNQKITVIAISQDSDVSELNSFLKLYDLKALENFSVVVDSEHYYSSQLGIDRLPETWIISSDHVLLKKVVGAIDWSSSDVVSYLKSLK